MKSLVKFVWSWIKKWTKNRSYDIWTILLIVVVFLVIFLVAFFLLRSALPTTANSIDWNVPISEMKADVFFTVQFFVIVIAMMVGK